MRVVQWQNSEHALAQELYRALERHGWVKALGASETYEYAEDLAQRIFEDAADLPVGAVVERRGEDMFVIRSRPALAA